MQRQASAAPLHLDRPQASITSQGAALQGRDLHRAVSVWLDWGGDLIGVTRGGSLLQTHPSHRPRRLTAPPAPARRPAAELITLTIKKPLGLVMSERKPSGEVFVEEIVPGGNAAATGLVAVGDVVAKTSAIVLKSGKEGEYSRVGHGQRPYDNFETVEFDCAGQDFNTVMAAISSNNERWGFFTVTLTLRRDASSATV